MEFSHVSVLLHETIEQLHIRPDGIYVDGTLGGGGHSSEICKQLSVNVSFSSHFRISGSVCYNILNKQIFFICKNL